MNAANHQGATVTTATTEIPEGKQRAWIGSKGTIVRTAGVTLADHPDETFTVGLIDAPTLGVGYIDDVGVAACIGLQDWDSDAMAETGLTIALTDDGHVDGTAFVMVTQVTRGHMRQANLYLPFPLLERAVRELREHEDAVRS